jgi:hypothetical protein
MHEFNHELHSSKDYFYRMPPVVSMRNYFGLEFVPDYPVFFLFDKYVIDAQTYKNLKKSHFYYYAGMASMFDALKATGRLEVQDYDSIIKNYRQEIEASVKYDMRKIESWAKVFEESSSRWRDFAIQVQKLLEDNTKGRELNAEELLLSATFFSNENLMIPFHYYRNIEDVLKGWRKRVDSQLRSDVRNVVLQYFRYLAANLCLSDVLDASIHDWIDMEPFYKKKLQVSPNISDQVREGMKQINQLFRLLFPAFEPSDPRVLVKALDDKRIEDLRSLVRDAVEGKVAFDDEYAVETMREVLKLEKRASRVREIVGWLTIPLNFVPWAGTFLQKGAEVALSHLTDSRIRRKKGWLYLVSNISKDTRKEKRLGKNQHR